VSLLLLTQQLLIALDLLLRRLQDAGVEAGRRDRAARRLVNACGRKKIN
jgi:hypothetical protein